MTDNNDEIQHAAQNMIDRYGNSALQEADLRILELRSRNQVDAARLWGLIGQRIEQLLEMPGSDSKH